MSAPPRRRTAGLLALAALVMAVAQVAGARSGGDPGTVRALHESAAATSLAGFLVVFAASLGYLRTRREELDVLGAAAAEVSAVLAGLSVVLGAIWSRAAGGAWWTWTPVLTTATVAFLLLGGCLVLRAFVEDGQRAARWSAAVGVLGFLNVPVVFLTIRAWRHAAAAPDGPPGPWGWTAATFAALLVLLTIVRYRIGAIGHAGRAAAADRALDGGTVRV